MSITKACCLILYNNKNEILLQHRDEYAEYFKGMWGIIGGAVEENETIVDCIIRECFEETNIRIKEPDFLFSITEHCIEYVFAVRVVGKVDIICKEGIELRFVSINKLNKYNISNYHRRIIMRAIIQLYQNEVME